MFHALSDLEENTATTTVFSMQIIRPDGQGGWHPPITARYVNVSHDQLFAEIDHHERAGAQVAVDVHIHSMTHGMIYTSDNGGNHGHDGQDDNRGVDQS